MGSPDPDNDAKTDAKPDAKSDAKPDDMDQQKGFHTQAMEVATTTADYGVWTAKTLGNAAVQSFNCSWWIASVVASKIWATPVVQDSKRFTQVMYEDVNENGIPGEKTLKEGSAIIEEWGGGQKLGAKVGGVVGFMTSGPAGAAAGAMVGAVVGSAADGVTTGTAIDNAADCIVNRTLPQKKTGKTTPDIVKKPPSEYEDLVNSYISIGGVPKYKKSNL